MQEPSYNFKMAKIFKANFMCALLMFVLCAFASFAGALEASDINSAKALCADMAAATGIVDTPGFEQTGRKLLAPLPICPSCRNGKCISRGRVARCRN